MKKFTYKDFDTATGSVYDDLVASIEKRFDINLAPNESFINYLRVLKVLSLNTLKF